MNTQGIIAPMKWRRSTPPPATGVTLRQRRLNDRLVQSLPSTERSTLFVVSKARENRANRKRRLSQHAITGFSSQDDMLSSVEVYDPSTGRWDFGVVFPATRWGLAAAVVGDCFYVMGGETLWKKVTSTYKYCKDNRQWTPVASMATPRRAHAAISKKFCARASLPGTATGGGEPLNFRILRFNKHSCKEGNAKFSRSG